MTSIAVRQALGHLLRGDEPAWTALGIEPPVLLDICVEEDLTGLVQQRVAALKTRQWPDSVTRELAAGARAEEARELLRRREIAQVLSALGEEGIAPVLFKGTALAYQVYDSPALRPRNDTDLIIRRQDADPVRRILGELGYLPPIYCDGELLFCQFEMQKLDNYGLAHAFDFHWKVSTQTLFADLLTYDELRADSVPLPMLGINAHAAGLVHALLLACVHPVMHHRGAERIIWLYDIHLLASKLARVEWERLTGLAVARGVAAICGHELRSARQQLGTPVPDDVLQRLGSGGATEATAAYLGTGRSWGDELFANVRGLKTWRDRARLLREVAFPQPDYMIRSYGLADGVLARAALPILYAHRGVAGILKVFRHLK